MRALEDLAYAARAVAAREIGSRELVDAALDRYRATEPVIHAFAWLDPERARRIAGERDNEAPRGILHGVPIAVKDIYDTAGLPTENGSRLFAGRVPDRSADVVTALEAAGAIVIGKTVTAELAYYAPGPTRNPYDRTRTPGGSSQGSAAAVAAGVVPAAVGSQTNGSVIRPAAFCGTVGYKPTGGRLPTRGALEFSHTLDQVGGFAGTAESAGWLAAAMAGDAVTEWLGEPIEAPRFAAVRTSDWGAADDAMRERYQADVDALAAAGGPIEWPELPTGLDDAVRFILIVMAYEAARTIGPLAAAHPELVSPQAQAIFERGRAIGAAEYDDAVQERRRLIAAFSEWIAPYDAILTPPALGEAPDIATTGDPRLCSRWTFVGAPAIAIPTGTGPSGLPLALQLVGARGADRRLLGSADWAEKRLSRPPRPAF